MDYIMRHEVNIPENWIDIRMGTKVNIIKEKQLWMEENIPETDWKMWASHSGTYIGGTTWYVSVKDETTVMAFKLIWEE